MRALPQKLHIIAHTDAVELRMACQITVIKTFSVADTIAFPGKGAAGDDDDAVA